MMWINIKAFKNMIGLVFAKIIAITAYLRKLAYEKLEWGLDFDRKFLSPCSGIERDPPQQSILSFQDQLYLLWIFIPRTPEDWIARLGSTASIFMPWSNDLLGRTKSARSHGPNRKGCLPPKSPQTETYRI